MDDLILAKLEPLPTMGSVGIVGQTSRGIVQAIYKIGERLTFRKFVQYVDGGGKRVTQAA